MLVELSAGRSPAVSLQNMLHPTPSFPRLAQTPLQNHHTGSVGGSSRHMHILVLKIKRTEREHFVDFAVQHDLRKFAKVGGTLYSSQEIVI
jgi:hypothetical protein